MGCNNVRIGDVASFRKVSVRPNAGTIYYCYSLPAFDNARKPEILDGSEILSNKLHVEDGDILVNKLNMRFKRIWPINNPHDNSVCSTEFVPLCPNDKINRDYLLYTLMSDDFTSTLSRMRTGTSGSHQRVKPEWILDYQFPLPSIEDQRKIGRCLSTLDQKIAINTRLNGYLEELLFSKYNEMFPDSANFTGVLSDVGEIIGGATPSKKKPEYYCSNGIGWITPRDLSNTSNKFIAHGADDITDAGYASCSVKLLPKGSVLFSSRAPIGYIAIATDAVTTNQGFKSVIPKEEIGTAFVYCFLVRNKQRIADMGAGTTFPELSSKMMKSVELAVPKQSTCAKFASFAAPIFKQQEALERENDELTALRDTLLPKLLSGEIDVSKVDLTQLNSHLLHHRMQHTARIKPRPPANLVKPRPKIKPNRKRGKAVLGLNPALCQSNK